MDTLTGLLNNAALMLILCVVYDTFSIHAISSKNLRDSLTGVLVGGICIAVMLNPWPFGQGIFFDTRSVLLSLVGLFFGFIPTAIAVVFAGAFRLYLGGSGALIGTIVIVATACVGLAGKHWKDKNNKTLNWIQLYFFGVVAHLGMLSCMYLFPAGLRDSILRKSSLPILLIYPVLTMIIGLILKKQEDRRTADSKLLYSTSLAKAALESSPDGILIVNLDGKITRWNQKYVELMHIPAHLLDMTDFKPILAHTSSQMANPEEFMAKVVKLYAHPEKSSIDTLYFADGRIFERYTQPQKVGNEIVGRFWQFHDITELIRNEELVNQSEQRFKSLFMEMTEGVAFHTLIRDDSGVVANYRIEMVNPAFTNIIGLSPDDVTGKLATEAYNVDTPPYLKEYSEVALSRKPSHFTTYFPQLDKYFDISAIPWETCGFATIFLDVTDRRKADQALQKSEDKFRTLFENAGDAIIVHDLNGNMVDVNQIACDRLGYSHEEFMGMSPMAIDIPEYAKLVPERVRQIMINKSLIFETCHVRKDGLLIPTEINSSLVDYDNQQVILSTARDITERKQSKDELQRLYRELSAISNCNKILIHAQDERVLLEDICKVVCEKAGYRLAWVGYAEQDEAKMVRPVAWAGKEEGYLDGARASWADTERGRGPTGTAIRQGETIYTQDFETDSNMAPWRNSALLHGFRSSIALPLKEKNGRAFGALTVYSSEPNAFTLVEIGMLEELADDMAFGINVLRSRKEQELAEKSLAESQSLLTSIIDSTKDLIWSVDPVSFGLRSYNRSFSEYFFNNLGIRLEGGLRPEDLFPPGEYVQGWHALYKRALHEGSFEIEMPVYVKPIILELSLNVLKINDEVFGVSVFGKNITESKRANQILAQTLQLTTLLAELSTQFLDATTAGFDDQVAGAQRRICKLMDLDASTILQQLPDSAPGFKVTHIYREQYPHKIPEADVNREYFPWCEQHVLGGKVIVVNSMAELPPEAAQDKESFSHFGTKSVLIYPLIDKGARVLGAVTFADNRDERLWAEELVKQFQLVAQFFANVILRKNAEEEKARLETQLHQAQKMESIGVLAGGVAHDFNNKLTVILGCSYLADTEMDAVKLHDYIGEIRKAAEQSADLTRQLLAFARKQTIAPKVLDLNETVSGMLKMLQRLIGEGINLNWHPAPNLWEVMLDPSQVDQILANLCVNSRDSITNIGKITIETGISVIDEEYCAQNAGFTAGEYVRLSVSDDGCGMDKETLAQIFEPFFTTKVLGEGTGLGLATVYGIVKQNNGFINVYSEPGLGTTFTIYLPRYTGNTEQAGTVDPNESGKCGRETILLVEDELSILNITKMLLAKHGYTVLAAHSPSEAIRLAGEQTNRIHLLMTDVVMPEMNGRDLAKKLQSLHPQLKCLYMSGYTANVIAHHGVLDEGLYFIQKPFNMNALTDKLREVLDSK